nr:AAA family ATPase [Streptomyces sp. SID8352]
MTPPTPPHGRPSGGGGPVPPPAGAHAVDLAPYRNGDQQGLWTWPEVRQAVLALVALALSGVLLGVLWWWLAPHVPLVGDAMGDSWVVYLKDSEGEQAVGVDGTFTLLALAFGAVTGAAVFLLRRGGGVPLAVALGAGGLLGSLVAWRVGIWLGPTQNVIAHARAVGKGVTFSAPLKLGAHGALLAWPIAALGVHLGLTSLFTPGDPDPDPYAPGNPGLPAGTPQGESPRGAGDGKPT